MIGYDRDIAVRRVTDRGDDRVRRPVVQQAVPELGVFAPWDQVRQLRIAFADDVSGEFKRSTWHPAVGAFDDVEGESGQAEVAPFLDEFARSPRIEVEVHGA